MNLVKAAAGCAFALFCLASAQSLSAQEKKVTVEDLKEEIAKMREEYEERIQALELALELLELDKVESVEDGTEERPGRMRRNDTGEYLPSAGPTMGASPGLIGELGQTDRFSRIFNPAVGVVLDTIATCSTSKGSRIGQDSFWLRAAELSLSARVDPFGYAYATFEAQEGEAVRVIEAAGVMNRLPANFSLKGGRFLADVTKFGQRHDHALPFVEKPGVLTDFIGGSLTGTGMELHQWFGLTDEIPLRWSVGVFTKLEGHTHAIGHAHHHHDEQGEHFPKRHLDNFSYGGRVTSYMDVTEESSVQLGSSAWWAPDIQVEHGDERHHTHRAVGALDMTYKWQDPASRRAFNLGGEALVSNGTFLHEHDGHHEIVDNEALGGYLWCEYEWNPYWSTGLLADAYSIKDASNVAKRDYSGFLTWKISPFNWLRFQYRYNDQDRGDVITSRDYHELMLQWSIVMGSHSHGLDW